MKTKYWMLLFFLAISFPLLSQDLIAQDTLSTISETTIINDISPSTLNQIIPNQGFSINSLWRGILGMFVLVLISYLLVPIERPSTGKPWELAWAFN